MERDIVQYHPEQHEDQGKQTGIEEEELDLAALSRLGAGTNQARGLITFKHSSRRASQWRSHPVAPRDVLLQNAPVDRQALTAVFRHPENRE